MSLPGGLLFLVAVPAILLLSGYWLHAWNLTPSRAGRLASALLGGLATLLVAAVAINCFRPLSGVWAWACLLPAVISLLRGRVRGLLLADLRHAAGAATARLVLALAGIFLTLLLARMLTDPQALFYDGNGNHDSYIWVTSGEHLQSHTYLQPPAVSDTQPWLKMAEDNVGLKPRRGQLGIETLLALFSSLAGTIPLHTCLYFAAALFLPWIAGVYLAVTTFHREQLSRPALAVLVLLQPIFIFYYANSNLPNLVGVLLGTTVVLATAQALRAGDRRTRLGWCLLLLLGFQGLLAGYPEMCPFILLGCGLLWLRPWCLRRWDEVRSRAGGVAAALVASVLLNPAITLRAWHGFQYSFGTARTEPIFNNLFLTLNPAEYLPGLVTLSVPATENLGYGPGAVLSLLLLAGLGAAWRRARDRWGVLCSLAGSGALMLYTLGTGFSYGWQKTVQFGGIFIAAACTVPVFELLREAAARPGWRRGAAGAGLAVLVGFFGYATAVNFLDQHRWNARKTISRDWYLLRDYAAAALPGRPVLVETGSFELPFHYTMWSTYFLQPSRVYFAAPESQGGGYLREVTRREPDLPPGEQAPLLVERRWADRFDVNSPRLLAGREFVLLRTANRVSARAGLFPDSGVPSNTATRFSLTVTPLQPVKLRVELMPHRRENWPEARWRILHRTESGTETVREVGGPPPWEIEVALVPGLRQTVECRVESPAGSAEEQPFSVWQFALVPTP